MTAPSRESVKLFCALAVKPQILPLIQQFEREQNVDVELLFDVNPNVAKRILLGETFDVGITNPWYVDELIAAGKVAAPSHRAFGRVPLALGKRAGRPGEVRISSEDIRALLLGAESVAYTGSGTSGKTFLEVLARLGIAQEMVACIKPLAASQPLLDVAAGGSEYGVAPLALVLAGEGVEPAAVFPSEVGADIDISVFTDANSSDASLARRLLDHLTDPAADAALRSGGITRFKLN